MSQYVFLSVRTQFVNMGDLLINRAILEVLHKQGDVYLDVSGVPKKYLELMLYELALDNVHLTKRVGFSLRMIFLCLKNLFVKKRVVSLVLKPGGYMAVKTSSFAFRRFLQGVWLNCLKNIGVNIVRAPSSQQNSQGIFRSVDKFRLSSLTTQLIRDEHSRQELLEMGLNSISSVDMGAYFFIKDRHCLFEPGFISDNQQTILSFSLRKPRFSNDLHSYNDVVKTVTNSIKGLDLQFVSQVYYDDDVNGEFSKKYDVKFTAYDMRVASVKDVTEVYRNSVYVFSNRLHVLLLALLSGSIPIAIVGEGDYKIIGCFEKLNLSENLLWLDRLSDFNFNQLRESWSFEKALYVKGLGLELEKQIIESLV